MDEFLALESWRLLWFGPVFVKFGCKDCQDSLLHELYPDFRVRGCAVLCATFDPPEINDRRNARFVFRVPMTQVSKGQAQEWGALRDEGDPWREHTPRNIAYLLDPGGSVVRTYLNPDPKNFASRALEDLRRAQLPATSDVG